MSEYLYLDIETIPTANAETIAAIAETITPPKTMSKPETIALWERETKPGLVADAVSKTSFNGAHGQICCIGWAWGDGPVKSEIDTIAGSELVTLRDAFAQIANEAGMGFPIIIGHYVANFDIRFIWQRAMVLGVPMPHWFPKDPKPWGREVFDTMAAWCGAKDSISLDNLCKALGIPGKNGIDGSMVAGMWARGEYDAIAEYCRDDVERVRNVHRKMRVAYGEAA